MGTLRIHNGKVEHTVIDPHDGRERPFCNSIGKLFAVAFNQQRYCMPTPEEDALWREHGQAQIERDNLCGPKLPVREATFG